MSLKQPAWHVMVLGVATFKIYLIYWCYKNWRDLSAQVKKAEVENAAPASSEIAPLTIPQKLAPNHLAGFRDCSPHLRAILCLIPYLSNYLFFTLSLGIAKLHPDKKSFVGAKPVLWSLTVAISMFGLSYLFFLPKVLFLLFLLSVIPMAIVQHELNKYWDSVEKPGLITRHGFSMMELMSIIIGALYLGFILSSFLILPDKSIP